METTVTLSGVPETMLWTLYNRAEEALRPDAFKPRLATHPNGAVDPSRDVFVTPMIVDIRTKGDERDGVRR